MKGPIASSLCCLSCFVDLFGKCAGDNEATSCDLGKMFNTLLNLAFSLGRFASINKLVPRGSRRTPNLVLRLVMNQANLG